MYFWNYNRIITNILDYRKNLQKDRKRQNERSICIMELFTRIVWAIWELPQTLLAVIIIALRRSRVTGREAYHNTAIIYLRDFPGGISLGRYIILNRRYKKNNNSKKHEYGHSVQSMYLGWLYLPVIGLPSILRVLIWKYRRLDPKDYYLGYPEDWANRLGFGSQEYLRAKKRLK
jgi:hypothetical protein